MSAEIKSKSSLDNIYINVFKSKYNPYKIDVITDRFLEHLALSAYMNRDFTKQGKCLSVI